jgi:5'-deoxynucleotidase YfbR-like HD superfamily hydrolase
MTHPQAQKIDLLYDLKVQPRGGWLQLLRRESPSPRIESVAEHTCGACLLALLCLSENDPAYDKNRVLRLLLVHDWAEAVLGDFAHDDKTVWKPESYQIREHELMRELCPELYDSWCSMEDGSTVEGRLAKDFDRLDSLIQLYRYRRDIEDAAAFEAFEENVSGKLQTEPVRALWTEFKPYFMRKYPPGRN